MKKLFDGYEPKPRGGWPLFDSCVIDGHLSFRWSPRVGDAVRSALAQAKFDKMLRHYNRMMWGDDEVTD